LKKPDGTTVTFPAHPFLGTVGVAPAGTGNTNSIPPDVYGGNLDIHYLVAGTTLYLPIQVKGAKLFVSDPHFAQGNGEVSLTAVEGSLRATMRLTVLKPGAPGYPSKAKVTSPFAETPDYWIPIGLDPDLNEAMKKAVRNAISYLSANQGVDPPPHSPTSAPPPTSRSLRWSTAPKASTASSARATSAKRRSLNPSPATRICVLVSVTDFC
jgi:acetamidase/formamidase